MPSQTPTPTPNAESDPPPYPLYNTSYTFHRLSPLHHPRSTRPFLSSATLTQHAQRLTSILRGDVLRGVRVDVDRLNDEAGDEGLGRSGALEGCEWTVLRRAKRGKRGRDRAGARTRSASASESSGAEAEAGAEEGEGKREGDKVIGVHVAIRYEKSTYTALLLRDPPRAVEKESQDANEDDGEDQDSDGTSTYLPLLLTRMPAALRATLASYLATTFDCHVAAVRLSSGFLVAALEGWLEDVRGGEGGAADGDGSGTRDTAREGNLQELVKDVHLTLSFAPPVAPALKTMEMVVQAGDVVGFLRAGENILRQQGRGQGEGKGDGGTRIGSRKRKRPGADADGAETDVEGMGPFTAALASYMGAHLAMSLGHSGVQVVKIACGAFVLAAEGRVRIVDSRRAGHGGDGEDGGERGEKAVRNFVARLVGRARSDGGYGGDGEEG